jgi:hypothetical protein
MTTTSGLGKKFPQSPSRWFANSAYFTPHALSKGDGAEVKSAFRAMNYMLINILGTMSAPILYAIGIGDTTVTANADAVITMGSAALWDCVLHPLPRGHAKPAWHPSERRKSSS